jgi:hypothetical protein
LRRQAEQLLGDIVMEIARQAQPLGLDRRLFHLAR